ncbi:MAG: hypothetical protein AUI14_16605 [Actinobacteria bacterium 13_2_20CM_2_71_6]|nr:MAG: hypothetical protein AUI14_16605 [Actinobacteria bacterium 13_2_20CM_2_71_6]
MAICALPGDAVLTGTGVVLHPTGPVFDALAGLLGLVALISLAALLAVPRAGAGRRPGCSPGSPVPSPHPPSPRWACGRPAGYSSGSP